MFSIIVAVILASLLGSPHCACMCGPLIAFTMGLEGESIPSRRRQLALYHSSRLLAYISLGALASLIGTALDQTGFLIGVQNCSAFLSALLLLLFGFISISRVYGYQLPVKKVPDNLHKFISLVHGKSLRLEPFQRAMATGILTSILPCGWLYVFVAIAVGAGSLLKGIVIMFAFWIGTLPMLTVCTFGIQKFISGLSPKIRLIPSIAIILLGIFTVSSRLMINDKNEVSSFENIKFSRSDFSSISKTLSQLKPACKNHDQ